MGRTLKNHDLYMEKLLAYAYACEITIEYKEMDGDGSYVPSRRKVKLDKDLPESTEVATLLHELGHSLDDNLTDKKIELVMDKAYKAFYKRSANKRQVEHVVECEKRAWVYGRGIAKKLRIPLGKWYDEEERTALEGYTSWRK